MQAVCKKNVKKNMSKECHKSAHRMLSKCCQMWGHAAICQKNVKINVLDTVCAYRYKAPPHSEHTYKTLYKHMQPQHPTTNHFDPPLYTVSIMCYNTYTKHFE